jgi:opacity protein-like surface antigen
LTIGLFLMGASMIARLYSGVCAAALLTSVILATSIASPARAENAPDTAELYKMMKALQGRVGALETEKNQAKREADQAKAEVRALRAKLDTRAPANPAVGQALAQPAAAPTYAMATKAPLPPVYRWTGLYGGVSFGIGGLSASDTTVFNSSSTNSSFTPAGVLTDTSRSTSSENEPRSGGRDWGALGDLFLGYNTVWGNNFLVGVQAEGTLSRVSTRTSGTGIFSGSSTNLNGVGAVTSSSNFTETFTTTNQITAEWMVSLLARVGYLIDPQDLIYVIGGYTYGRFSSGGGFDWFGMNGATIGGGFERQMWDGWSIRAEGRYTKFTGGSFGNPGTSTEPGTSFDAAGAVTTRSLFTSSSNSTTSVSADLWTVRLGVVKQLNGLLP